MLSLDRREGPPPAHDESRCSSTTKLWSFGVEPVAGRGNREFWRPSDFIHVETVLPRPAHRLAQRMSLIPGAERPDCAVTVTGTARAKRRVDIRIMTAPSTRYLRQNAAQWLRVAARLAGQRRDQTITPSRAWRLAMRKAVPVGEPDWRRPHDGRMGSVVVGSSVPRLIPVA